MMHPALIHLIRLQYRGKIRNGIQKLKTLRGAFYFVMMLLMFGFWLGPQIAVMIMQANENPERFRQSAENFRLFFPYGMLVFCLASVVFSSAEKAIYFKPNEIDFLFPGPFHRRELLIYKIITLLIGALFPALLFSCFLLRFAHHGGTLFVGAYLALCFMMLFGMLMLLIRHSISQRAFTTLRQVLLGVIVFLLGVAGYLVLVKIEAQTLWQGIKQFPETRWGEILLFPFLSYSNTMMAESLGEFVMWGTAALGLNVILLGLIIRLDTNFLETALHISRKIYQRSKAAKKSGRVAVFKTKKEAKRSFPMLPRWGGSGPILWRQILSAFRNSKNVLFMIPLFLIIVFPILIRNREIGQGEIWGFLGLILWMSIFFTQWVAFDFRAEIDRMEWLKQLPISSMAAALGEILVPTCIYVALELLLLGGIAILQPEAALTFLTAMVFIIPVNFMIFGVENFVFLLFPVRMVQTTPGDFQHMGRIMLFFLLKLIVILLALGLAALLGIFFYFLFLKSMLMGIIGAWIMLVLCALAFLPLTAWAYNRFDVSVHTPT